MSQKSEKILRQALNEFELKAWVWTKDRILVGTLELLDEGVKINGVFISDDEIQEIKFFVREE